MDARFVQTKRGGANHGRRHVRGVPRGGGQGGIETRSGAMKSGEMARAPARCPPPTSLGHQPSLGRPRNQSVMVVAGRRSNREESDGRRARQTGQIKG